MALNFWSTPAHAILTMLAGWIHREQEAVVAYQKEEIRALKEMPVLCQKSAHPPNAHLSPTLSGRWDGSVASAWRAVSLAGISLLVEMSSLFLITGNLPLRLRKGFGISALNPPGGSSFEGAPEERHDRILTTGVCRASSSRVSYDHEA